MSTVRIRGRNLPPQAPMAAAPAIAPTSAKVITTANTKVEWVRASG
jgi:hypothetical protein